MDYTDKFERFIHNNNGMLLTSHINLFIPKKVFGEAVLKTAEHSGGRYNLCQTYYIKSLANDIFAGFLFCT